MKLLDKIIRSWRTNVAIKQLTLSPDNIFDIGCDEGYLLKKFSAHSKILNGCDPKINPSRKEDGITIYQGYFPSVADNLPSHIKYDAIFSLAVFEHFTEEDLRMTGLRVSEMLSPKGVLIATLPNPLVDSILDILTKFKLIDGQSLEEHHGFDPRELPKYLSPHLTCIKHRYFQFGLNNVFIFQKNIL